MKIHFHVTEYECKFYLIPTIILTFEPTEGVEIGIAWLKWETTVTI